MAETGLKFDENRVPTLKRYVTIRVPLRSNNFKSSIFDERTRSDNSRRRGTHSN
jgi:hypothetical protein